MENELKKLNSLKEINLSESEKGLIRSHVNFLINNPLPKTQSLWQRGIYHGLRVALSSLVFLVFVGGAVSAVADNALPGDPLYSFKLNINEEIQGFFKQTPAEKVAYGAQRVENRVKEIKTLADSKSLTQAKQLTVQKAINEHIKDLSTNLNTLSNTSPNAALAVTASLEENLKANKIIIENSSDSSTAATEVAVSNIDNAIQKVSNQEVKIISKEIDSISTDLDQVPTANTTLNAEADAQTDTKSQAVTTTNSTNQNQAPNTSTSTTEPSNAPKQ